MADESHVAIITGHQGVTAWNEWRQQNPDLVPDLSEAKLMQMDLSWANFKGARLIRADLSGSLLSPANLSTAKLSGANFTRATLAGANLADSRLLDANFRGAVLNAANFTRASLHRADFGEAYLRGTRLTWARLYNANFYQAKLEGANLTGAILQGASFVKATLTGAILNGANLVAADLTGADLRESALTNANLVSSKLEGADLTGCRVYGASVWDVDLAHTAQKDLVITRDEQPTITVDHLDVAQFVYLLLNNSRIRDVIDTITSKAVLILGRFTAERKKTLDALRDALRAQNYLPILFDFEKPDNRDYTETVSTLAHLSRFVIADLTDPRSIPQELTAIIPQLQSVPVCPLLRGDRGEWSMFRDLARRVQVIEAFHYEDDEMLLTNLVPGIIEPAERKARELAGK